MNAKTPPPGTVRTLRDNDEEVEELINWILGYMSDISTDDEPALAMIEDILYGDELDELPTLIRNRWQNAQTPPPGTV